MHFQNRIFEKGLSPQRHCGTTRAWDFATRSADIDLSKNSCPQDLMVLVMAHDKAAIRSEADLAEAYAQLTQ